MTQAISLMKSITFRSLSAGLTAMMVALIAAVSFAGAAAASSFDRVSFSQKDKALSSYEEVYIAPVEVSLPEAASRFALRRGRGERGVSERDQSDRAQDLYDSLSYSIGERFSLADAPGPGVLTVRATITRLASTRPTVEDYRRDVNLDLNSIYTGGADISIVLTENGSEVATLSDSDFGNLNDGRIRAGIWSDADRAFSRWGRKLAKFLAKN